MKLALYQGASPQGDTAEALARVERMLASAAMAGAELAVFPELFLPGYNQMQSHDFAVQSAGGLWETTCSKLAANYKCGLCIGWAEQANGITFNAASCFGTDGAKLAHYRKQHLYGAAEKSVFAPGNSDCIFTIAGKKAALLICYDVEFAHRVRGLHASGVELLLVPTANPIAFDVVADAIVPARAFENRMTIAYANLCGTENNLTFGGHSVVVGPDGALLAKAGRGETLLMVDLATVDSIDQAMLSTQLKDLGQA